MPTGAAVPSASGSTMPRRRAKPTSKMQEAVAATKSIDLLEVIEVHLMCVARPAEPPRVNEIGREPPPRAEERVPAEEPRRVPQETPRTEPPRVEPRPEARPEPPKAEERMAPPPRVEERRAAPPPAPAVREAPPRMAPVPRPAAPAPRPPAREEEKR